MTRANTPDRPGGGADAGATAAATPGITVVTVCRNALELLRPTVESVLAQDYPALEYWIVDGASTDGTGAYLDSLAARGVRVLSEPDRGIADAMNKGARLASGEWVAHLHAGDAYLPGTLEVVARHAAGAPEVDVLCGWIVKHESPRWGRSADSERAIYRCAPELLPRDMTVNHPATWTRRALFERLGGFDERYPNAMDYEFFLRLHAAGCRFGVIEAPLASMAAGGQSERSLWTTFSETHAIRRRLLRGGFSRSPAYFLALVARGTLRRALQRAGLGGAVRWFRRRFALLPKG
jgi:GT2 family glycosyltransferase